jgi:hypothetical protein
VAAAAKRLTRRDYQRWARRGSTEARGYGHQHRKERERRLALYRPGDPCAHCGQPMTWWPLAVARRFIDLPHNATRTGYLPGLACRRCNRADGARRGNRMYGPRGAAKRWAAARRWLSNRR